MGNFFAPILSNTKITLLYETTKYFNVNYDLFFK